MPIDESRFQLLKGYASHHNIPLIVVHSTGFYSYFSVILPGTFPIVDTHPDETATTDLRLLSPWSELSEFSQSMTKDIDSLDSHEHGHLPLVVILLHYLEKWRENHDGANPVSYSDKIAFRDLVSKAMRRDNPEGGEENFEEAVAAVMKHVVQPSVPGTLKQLFDYQHQDNVCLTLPSKVFSNEERIRLMKFPNRSHPNRASGSLPLLSKSSTKPMVSCLSPEASPT